MQDAESQTTAASITPWNGADYFGPVFWLAVILLRAFPQIIAVAYTRSRQAYSSGGCTGVASRRSFTGFPFNAIPDGMVAPKTQS
jgi:hypothetical protein